MRTSSYKEVLRASFNFLFLSSNGKKLKNAHPYFAQLQNLSKAKFFIQPPRQTRKEISSWDFSVLCYVNCVTISPPPCCLFQVEKYICSFISLQQMAIVCKIDVVWMWCVFGSSFCCHFDWLGSTQIKYLFTIATVSGQEHHIVPKQKVSCGVQLYLLSLLHC